MASKDQQTVVRPKEPEVPYGMTVCQSCEGNQGKWIGTYWYWCRFCDAKGFVRL